MGILHRREGRFRVRPVTGALGALALALVVAACGSTGSSPTPPPTPVRTTPPATAAPTAGPGSPSPTPSPSPASRPDLTTTIALEVVADGLDAPLYATTAGDGSGRVFVVEQAGRVRVVRDGSVLAAPFVDLTDRVTAGGERGLLGLAFAPGYGREGEDRLYVHYSNRDGDTTIAELRAAPGSDVADPASLRIVLTEDQPYSNHNGGWIGFDPSGMLLVALGDGGSAGDPEDRAERLDTLLGKVLRIDVLGTADGYRVPADNPFVGREGARPEILHLGLRNPWRASIDPASGDLWIGDVGQGAWEEIDVARGGAAGLDFGWNSLEGTHCYEPADGCDREGRVPPVAEYPHTLGCSVVGGHVYRGAAIPGLAGAYLFSDYCTGTLWGIDAGLEALQAPVTLLETGRTVGSFGEDEAGELLLLDLAAGEVLRMVPG